MRAFEGAAGGRHAAETVRSTTPFGIAASRPRIDPARVHDHVHRVIAAIAPNDSAERFTAMGVTVLRGEAKFADARTVVVGDTMIKARRVIIATGSRPAVPPIPGLADAPFLTNDTIFDLSTRPDRLLILGGGPVGIELAQAFRRLGSEVTVVEAGRALGRIDPEITAHALTVLRREGVRILEQTKAARAEHWAGGIRLVLEGGEMLEGSHLLVAAGRTPTLEGLGLDAAGVRHRPHGHSRGCGHAHLQPAHLRHR